MNPTHLHLILNHIPVLSIAFGLGLLVFGMGRKSQELKKAALGVFFIIALLAVPAYLTGEPAEDGVKSLLGFSTSVIEQHEQAATVAFTGILVLGAAALTGLLMFRRGKMLPSWFGSLVLAHSKIVSGLMVWTARLGGQIRHSEIRSAASPAAATGHKD